MLHKDGAIKKELEIRDSTMPTLIRSNSFMTLLVFAQVVDSGRDIHI